MRETLLELLCCPVCRVDLALDAETREGEEILSGKLRCGGCGKEYLVIGGVPRMLPDALPEDMALTAKNFGQSWKLWKDIDDERYRWQFLRWVQPLQPEDFKGKTVLDCGCGKGRHLRVAAQFGTSQIVGVDLSEAVDVAFANTRDLKNVHVVQADIYRLPLKGNFDLAYSVGVLHHTPDPGKSFQSMTQQVRADGTVACWVYGRENNWWIVKVVNPLRIGITRHLPSWMVRAIAWVLATVIFCGIYLVYVPAHWIGLKPFYADYMLYLKDLGFAEARHIVYDHLIAPTAFYLRKDEVAAWFETAKIPAPTLSWVQKVSWAGVGRKSGQ